MRRSGIYRPCAGAMIINKYNQVWLGKRLIKSDNPKKLPLWQMPQGGIDMAKKQKKQFTERFMKKQESET